MPKGSEELVPNAQNHVCASLVFQKNPLCRRRHLFDCNELIAEYEFDLKQLNWHAWHLQAQETWVGIEALPLSSCETLVKLVDFCRPQFLHWFTKTITLNSAAPGEVRQRGARGRVKCESMENIVGTKTENLCLGYLPTAASSAHIQAEVHDQMSHPNQVISCPSWN